MIPTIECTYEIDSYEGESYLGSLVAYMCAAADGD